MNKIHRLNQFEKTLGYCHEICIGGLGRGGGDLVISDFCGGGDGGSIFVK